MQIEKVQAEGTIKKFEESLAVYEDANNKGIKEKKLIEERLADVNATLAEEEEKSKHLSKLKAKHESTIGELEDKLRKDNQQRQEVERAKRKIETELNDLKEQVGEKKTQVRLFLIIFSQKLNFRFDLNRLPYVSFIPYFHFLVFGILVTFVAWFSLRFFFSVLPVLASKM